MFDIKKLKTLAKNFTVLYVEDEKCLRESFVQYLNKFFKIVDFAVDGKDGLEKYKQGKYDLVITDISMPNLNGIEMSQQIRELNSNQEIVITSAFSDFDILSDAIKIGIDGYMLKPINYNQMNEILYKVVHKLQEFKENDLYRDHLNELLEIKSSELKDLQKEKIENYKFTLYALVDLIEKRDTYTGGHSNRVAKYSFMIAKHMGIAKKDCNDIYEAAMLHDIGKIVIPDSILLKPGSLNELEYKLIQEHATIGYSILKKVPIFKEYAKIIKSHHERLDGSGYPDGIKGDDIPTFSMIIAVADTFDAMTTSRIYKAKKSVKESLHEINRLKGKLFFEQVVDAAMLVLKDIKLDDSIHQLPRTNLEKARFSYFYVDQMTKAYNKNYLDLVLTQNSHDDQYNKVALVLLRNFGKYNNIYGWDKGSELLIKVVKKMQELYTDALLFRVHGDDFVLISSNSLDLNLISKFFEEEKIDFSKKVADLKEKKLFSMKLFENFIDETSKNPDTHSFKRFI